MLITPTWRDSRCASLARSCCSTAPGSTPLASRSSPRGPYSTIVDAWVQTAPTPARTCGTARPTNGTRVVTAAPDWLVAGSIAHSENVEYCGSPAAFTGTPSDARSCARLGLADNRRTSITRERRFRYSVIEHLQTVVQWSSGPVVQWSSGPVVQWSSGPVVHYGDTSVRSGG